MWRDPNVDSVELRRAIEENEVRGGSAIGCAVARVIAVEVAQLRSEPQSTLKQKIHELHDWALATKPSMSTVHAAVGLAQRTFEHGVLRGLDSAQITDDIITAMEGFIEKSVAAVESLGECGLSVVQDGATIVVHSFSESILSVLRIGATNRRGLKLMFTESRPLRESRYLAGSLADLPLEMTLYTDAGLGIAASKADLAVVGADAVFRDGSFVNKTGTLLLAFACAEYGVPLYVATETGKIASSEADERQVTMEMRPAAEVAGDWELVAQGRVQVHNQFFEVTPAKFVTGYITESGLFGAEEIGNVAHRM